MTRAALVALAGSFLLAACDAGPLRNLAAGTSSKDKKPIPPTVTAAANPTAARMGKGALPVQGPVATDKVTTPEAPSVPDDPSKPLRIQEEEYRAAEQRDPFVSLLGGDNGRSDLVDLSVVRLVAIVTSGEQPFCVVEDAEGLSFILRAGDPVKNGRVVAVKPDALVCSQTILGYTTTVQLKLEERRGRM
jgi:hypothetical protein